MPQPKNTTEPSRTPPSTTPRRMKQITKTQSFCRECGQRTWHNIVASVKREELEVEEDHESQSGAIYSDNVYELLQCCGCECVTMRRTATCDTLFDDEEIVRHFPPSTARRRPAWESQLPFPVQSLLLEVYNALHSGGLRLAVMGARTLVDTAIINKVGDAGTFEQKLEALRSGGFVSKQHCEVLAAALNAGNASAHRGHKFKSEEVNQVMDIVENLLQAIYVLGHAAEKIKTATPARKKASK